MGFKLQIAALILGPSFISASIDLVLKWTGQSLKQDISDDSSSTTATVISFGSKYSRIPAKWYTWLFIGADVFAILCQAAGGGLATSGVGF